MKLSLLEMTGESIASLSDKDIQSLLSNRSKNSSLQQNLLQMLTLEQKRELMGYEFALGFERPRKGEFIKQPLSQEEINR